MSDYVPFYRYSLDNARHCNEIDEWRASHKANLDCVNAIKNAMAVRMLIQTYMMKCSMQRLKILCPKISLLSSTPKCIPFSEGTR